MRNNKLRAKPSVRIGIIGCGVVGASLIKAIWKNREISDQKVGAYVSLAAVCDTRPSRIKKAFYGIRNHFPALKTYASYKKIINDPSIDIVVELVGGIGIAYDIIIEALMAGKHVVTANKAVLAEHWYEIFTIANERGLMVYFEAAVMAGVPVVQGLNEGLSGNSISGFSGIVNGTTNFILWAMANLGVTYEEALKMAQKAGYAEKDPTTDVMNKDAMHKLLVLASIISCTCISEPHVQRWGITDVRMKDIERAKAWGYVIKSLV